MDWFYAEGDNRRGPVTDAGFRALIADGTITPATLVWRQGMPRWQELRDSGFEAGPAASGGPPTQRCFITGKIFPTSQMLETEHGWVSAGARDIYYQCLRESVPFPVPEGTSNARSDGKRVIVPTGNPVLPRRCIKTNQPVTEADVKRKKLFWCSPWVVVTLFLNILIFIILYLIVRKAFTIDIPLSQEGRRIVRRHALIAGAMGLAGVALLFVALVGTDLLMLMFPAVVLVLAGIIYGVTRGAAVRIVRYNAREVALKGACPAYLAALPRA